jgi:hypothetical protein
MDDNCRTDDRTPGVDRVAPTEERSATVKAVWIAPVVTQLELSQTEIGGKVTIDNDGVS